MFLSQLSDNPQYYFAVIIVVVISICLHELAHGFAAIALGDRTPEETGHITLNPLVHMGPMSLVMLAIAGISWGLMPIDPSRMRGKYASALVAVAGPLTNLVLAFLGMTAFGLWAKYGTIDRTNHMVDNGVTLLTVMGFYNLVLFALNLLPLPPLDGSRIVANFSPAYRRLMGEPAMQGVFLACTFGVFIAGGPMLSRFAGDVMGRYLSLFVG